MPEYIYGRGNIFYTQLIYFRNQSFKLKTNYYEKVM
jgi:hypothetical protein